MAAHVITGAAIANCLGGDNRAVFENAFAGADCFAPSTEFFDFPFSTVLGILPELRTESNAWLECAPTRLARVACASVRQLRPAVHAAAQRWGPARVAYIFASSTGGLEHTERFLAPHVQLPRPAAAYRYDEHGVDATSGALARTLGAEGIQLAVSTACSSSFRALTSAVRLIDCGLADAAVIGSADSLCRTTVFGFYSLGLIASTATQPFARDRCGLTLGEGSAYILIERSTEVTRHAALASVTGFGATSDAFHQTSPPPDGRGGEACMRRALAYAGLALADIDCVSAHGTGTKSNDAAEGAALARLFGARIPVTATKSLTGHTLGSAGLTALVLAVESLRRQQIPPTPRAAPVDEALGLSISTGAVSLRLRHILLNAFGFGGSNASIVISEPAAAAWNAA